MSITRFCRTLSLLTYDLLAVHQDPPIVIWEGGRFGFLKNLIATHLSALTVGRYLDAHPYTSSTNLWNL